MVVDADLVGAAGWTEPFVQLLVDAGVEDWLPVGPVVTGRPVDLQWSSGGDVEGAARLPATGLAQAPQGAVVEQLEDGGGAVGVGVGAPDGHDQVGAGGACEDRLVVADPDRVGDS